MTVSKFIQIRRDLHRIPEIGFKEWKTQQYILDYIGTLSHEFVEVKTWKTGVIVKVNGKIPKNNRLSCRYRRFTNYRGNWIRVCFYS